MVSMPNFYNYYFRYLWTAGDFENHDEAMINSFRGLGEGAFGGAVLSGMEVIFVSGRTVEVAIGEAAGPDGYLHVRDEAVEVTFDEPASGMLRRDLVVSRPLLTDNTLIQDPADPNGQVYLRTEQGSEIVVIKGTEAVSPEYPSAGATDVVLAGALLEQGFNMDGNSDLDYEVRDIPGKNAPLQMSFGKYDDRMRPYKVDHETIGIMPSLVGYRTAPNDTLKYPVGLSYNEFGKPSQFPRGAFDNFSGMSDSFYNLTTGVVSGADEQSANFTPSIPAAGQFRIILLQVAADDKISIKSAAAGSKSGAYTNIFQGGLLADTGNKAICYAIVYSKAGSAINDYDLIDARHPGNIIVSGLIVNPMTGPGDLIRGGTAGAATRLAPGLAGEVLRSGGAAAPVWDPNFTIDPSTGVWTAKNGVISGTSHGGSGLKLSRSDGTYNAGDYTVGLSDTGNDGLSIRNAVTGTTDLWKVLPSGLQEIAAGIKFPATQVASSDANTLDDYEGGTFTPALAYNVPGTSAFNYAGTPLGTYRKIGDLVYITIQISLQTFSKGTASGQLMITGLPFASPNAVMPEFYMSMSFETWTFTNIPIAFNRPNSSTIFLRTTVSAAVQANMTDPSNTSTVFVSGCYVAAA